MGKAKNGRGGQHKQTTFMLLSVAQHTFRWRKHICRRVTIEAGGGGENKWAWKRNESLTASWNCAAFGQSHLSPPACRSECVANGLSLALASTGPAFREFAGCTKMVAAASGKKRIDFIAFSHIQGLLAGRFYNPTENTQRHKGGRTADLPHPVPSGMTCRDTFL